MLSLFRQRIFIRTLLCCLLALIPFPELENHIFDIKLTLRGPVQAPADILLLELNRDDFEELKQLVKQKKPSVSFTKQSWLSRYEELQDLFFWNNVVYEHILERILKDNPKFFLISYFYPESTIHLKDNPKLQNLVRNQKIIWASQFDADQNFVKPAPELSASENYGFINVILDQDQVVRRAFLTYHNHASLPFRALLSQGTFPKDISFTNDFLINFRGSRNAIPSCRLLSLFKKTEEHCPDLANKYLLLSITGTGATENTVNFQTPLGNMSRAEILANILYTVKERKFLMITPWFMYLLFLILHIYIFAYAVLAFDFKKQFLLLGGITSLEALTSIILLRVFRLQIPLVPFFIASASAYFVFLWLKVSREERKRWQAIKRAQYLRELDELKSNFISLMSHDLKTPIAKIQALTERFQRETKNLSSIQQEALLAIQAANDELSRYIVSILNFQKVESQELTLHSKSNDINVLIEEVVERLKDFANEKNMSIILKLEPQFATEFDEQLIRQVLNNLIDNAIKYNKTGTEITIHSYENDEFLVVEVQDNGKGISAEDLPYLFTKFSRMKQTKAGEVKGTGLGLYLSKYFIELHGGKIEVDNRPGKGCTFRFYLPK